MMDSVDSMASHISKLENVCRQSRESSEQISELMFITKILMTLPDIYKHFYSI